MNRFAAREARLNAYALDKTKWRFSPSLSGKGGAWLPITAAEPVPSARVQSKVEMRIRRLTGRCN
jgi:hypothetical protein